MRKFSSNKYHDLIKGSFEPAPLGSSVPDFAYNPLNTSGDLYTPVIDIEWLRKKKPPVWPDNKKFAVCLTHDVDAVSELDLMQNIRVIKKLLQTTSQRPLGETLRRSVEHKLNALKGLIGKADHLCKFENWMDLEAKHGARSTFFFAPEHAGQPHNSDCMYKYDQGIEYRGTNISVAEMMRDMDRRGWEIGLHPSWGTHDNLDEMVFQKQQVEAVLDHPIYSVRQHFLKYDPLNTHRIQSEAGFKYDSTMGYNDNLGFRRGSSYPFNCFDLKAGQSLPLLQVPLIIQDGALLAPGKGMRLDSDKAVEYIKLLISEVREVGGVLTLSWHPHTFNRPAYFDVYGQVLELLEKETPWFATVNEVGEWWREQSKIDLLNFTADLSST
jgi:peptidoglycan/xylan/chitin deacetylase (PgdA/CDA1 family)